MHGVARATLDVDFVADVRAEHIDAIVAAIKDTYYYDENAIREAVKLRRSFNLVHLATFYKVDVFVLRRRRFDQQQIQRGKPHHLSDDIVVITSTPEDILLAKFDWYRLGGEVSEMQWRDILGILRTNTGRLEMDYLREMADDLGVADLLRKALQEVSGLRET